MKIKKSQVVPVYALETYTGSRITAPLILSLGAGRRSVVTCAPAFHREEIPIPTECENGWVPQTVWRRKNILPCRNSNPVPSSLGLVAITGYAIPASRKTKLREGIGSPDTRKQGTLRNLTVKLNNACFTPYTLGIQQKHETILHLVGMRR